MVTRDGKTAVFISAGFGAGWSTWNSDGFYVFGDETLVDMVEGGASPEQIEDYVRSVMGNVPYLGGVDGLYVMWVPVGEKFVIQEYDGSESIRLMNETNWYTA